MKTASLAEMKAHLGDYLKHAETEGPVIITRNGKAVAVLLAPQDDDDLEELMLARNQRFLTMLGRSKQSIATGKALSEGEFWAKVEHRKRQRVTAKRKRS